MKPLFGIHESALLLRARRTEVLAENLANADTPGYKARDLDFAAALRAQRTGTAQLVRTDDRHLGPRAADSSPLAFRMPHQPARDGNTVESDLEHARFAENAVGYQASLMFINGRIAMLRAAITGGR